MTTSTITMAPRTAGATNSTMAHSAFYTYAVVSKLPEMATMTG